MKLKTLKDLAKPYNKWDEDIFEDEIICKGNKGKRYLELVRIKDLKQEAIKWIKAFDYEEEGAFYKKEMLIEFFNLTEEDLNETTKQ